MSVEAITWAFSLPIKHSTVKFVLVALANCANGDELTAFPSTAYLAKTTGQDRKTVLTNIKKLVAMGAITDTGERRGATKQVVVYRVNTQLKPSEILDNKKAKNGTVPKTEQSQISSETVPFFPPKSTVFPSKESQKRDTEPYINRKGTVKETEESFSPPSWMPVDPWKAFLKCRTKLKAENTGYALTVIVKKLEEFRTMGHAPADVLNNSIVNGWKGVFAPKQHASGKPQSPKRHNLQA